MTTTTRQYLKLAKASSDYLFLSTLSPQITTPLSRQQFRCKSISDRNNKTPPTNDGSPHSLYFYNGKLYRFNTKSPTKPIPTSPNQSGINPPYPLQFIPLCQRVRKNYAANRIFATSHNLNLQKINKNIWYRHQSIDQQRHPNQQNQQIQQNQILHLTNSIKPPIKEYIVCNQSGTPRKIASSSIPHPSPSIQSSTMARSKPPTARMRTTAARPTQRNCPIYDPNRALIVQSRNPLVVTRNLTSFGAATMTQTPRTNGNKDESSTPNPPNPSSPNPTINHASSTTSTLSINDNPSSPTIDDDAKTNSTNSNANATNTSTTDSTGTAPNRSKMEQEKAENTNNVTKESSADQLKGQKISGGKRKMEEMEEVLMMMRFCVVSHSDYIQYTL